MARQGRVDRVLVLKRNAADEKVWYVRLSHHGKEGCPSLRINPVVKSVVK